MYKIVAQIEADGGKKNIYELKGAIMQVGSQNSCKINVTITSDQGFQEMMSASFQPIIDVSSDDIVDLTLTGDEQYALLIHEEDKEIE